MNLTKKNIYINDFIINYKLIIKDHHKYNILYELENGVIDTMSEIEIYNFIANTCASYIYKDNGFNILANKYQMYKLQNQTKKTYINHVKKNFLLMSEKFLNFFKCNINYIMTILSDDRDNLIDLCGLENHLDTYIPYVFLNPVNNKLNQQSLNTIKNSNLCVGGETMILTDNGYFEISSLKDKNVNIWNGEKFSNVKIIQTGINDKLIKVNFSNNVSIECTPQHKFHIFDYDNNYSIVDAINLKTDMEIINYRLPILKLSNNNIKSNNQDIYYVPINESIDNKIKWLIEFCANTNANVLINNENIKYIILYSINLTFLQNIRLMLTTLSINSKIILKYKHFDVNIKKCINKYILEIKHNHLFILQKLGFKNSQLDNNFNIIDEYYKNIYKLEILSPITIKSIENTGRIDNTYCFSESEKHMGIFNGIITGNCSEIIEIL